MPKRGIHAGLGRQKRRWKCIKKGDRFKQWQVHFSLRSMMTPCLAAMPHTIYNATARWLLHRLQDEFPCHHIKAVGWYISVFYSSCQHPMKPDTCREGAVQWAGWKPMEGLRWHCTVFRVLCCSILRNKPDSSKPFAQFHLQN